ncbi:hypothetical protein [Vibrio sp. WXL210]|uniref:hypothetical protein n=1 Tax=Vibrio sp. WXL210 TaxID=3450709 RepID=UPI003EC5803C
MRENDTPVRDNWMKSTHTREYVITGLLHSAYIDFTTRGNLFNEPDKETGEIEPMKLLHINEKAIDARAFDAECTVYDNPTNTKTPHRFHIEFKPKATIAGIEAGTAIELLDLDVLANLNADTCNARQFAHKTAQLDDIDQVKKRMMILAHFTEAINGEGVTTKRRDRPTDKEAKQVNGKMFSSVLKLIKKGGKTPIPDTCGYWIQTGAGKFDGTLAVFFGDAMIAFDVKQHETPINAEFKTGIVGKGKGKKIPVKKGRKELAQSRAVHYG